MVGLVSQPILPNVRARQVGHDLLPSSTAEVLSATFDDVLATNPQASIDRLLDIREAESPLRNRLFEGTGITPESMGGRPLEEPSRLLRPEEAAETYGLSGALTFDAPVREDVAKIMADAKRAEMNRADVFRRAQGGLVEGAARLGVGLLGSALDPLNVASAFIPVVGPARYALWLERAGPGALARAGVRARAGAIEGAAGAALLEPVVLAGQSRLQSDYDAVDSLLNIAFGTVLGGGLHAGVGRLADALGRADPATREAALRTAVGQMAEGRAVDVDALLRQDMAFSIMFPETAGTGTAGRGGAVPGLPRGAAPAPGAASRGPAPSREDLLSGTAMPAPPARVAFDVTSRIERTGVPVEEVAAAARALDPETAVRAEAIDARLAAAEARLAVLAERIGTPAPEAVAQGEALAALRARRAAETDKRRQRRMDREIEAAERALGGVDPVRVGAAWKTARTKAERESAGIREEIETIRGERAGLDTRLGRAWDRAVRDVEARRIEVFRLRARADATAELGRLRARAAEAWRHEPAAEADLADRVAAEQAAPLRPATDPGSLAALRDEVAELEAREAGVSAESPGRPGNAPPAGADAAGSEDPGQLLGRAWTAAAACLLR